MCSLPIQSYEVLIGKHQVLACHLPCRHVDNLSAEVWVPGYEKQKNIVIHGCGCKLRLGPSHYGYIQESNPLPSPPLLQLLPMWLAPNLLTLVGWLLLMLNFWLLAYYDWDYNTSTSDRDLHRQPIPAAVWVYCGVAHFLSYMLDGMDGKQARRTASSTPLGMYRS